MGLIATLLAHHWDQQQLAQEQNRRAKEAKGMLQALPSLMGLMGQGDQGSSGESGYLPLPDVSTAPPGGGPSPAQAPGGGPVGGRTFPGLGGVDFSGITDPAAAESLIRMAMQGREPYVQSALTEGRESRLETQRQAGIGARLATARSQALSDVEDQKRQDAIGIAIGEGVAPDVATKWAAEHTGDESLALANVIKAHRAKAQDLYDKQALATDKDRERLRQEDQADVQAGQRARGTLAALGLDPALADQFRTGREGEAYSKTMAERLPKAKERVSPGDIQAEKTLFRQSLPRLRRFFPGLTSEQADSFAGTTSGEVLRNLLKSPEVQLFEPRQASERSLLRYRILGKHIDAIEAIDRGIGAAVNHAAASIISQPFGETDPAKIKGTLDSLRTMLYELHPETEKAAIARPFLALEQMLMSDQEDWTKSTAPSEEPPATRSSTESRPSQAMMPATLGRLGFAEEDWRDELKRNGGNPKQATVRILNALRRFRDVGPEDYWQALDEAAFPNVRRTP